MNHRAPTRLISHTSEKIVVEREVLKELHTGLRKIRVSLAHNSMYLKELEGRP